MSTRGWEGIDPALLEQKARPRRPTVGEQVLEQALQSEVERLLAGLQRLGRIQDWCHVREMRRSRPGLPDLIIGVRPGLVLAIELKRPDGRGRVSEEQARWMRCWGKQGTVATSAEQVIEFLRGWEV